MKNKFSKMIFAFVATIALSVSTVSATWVSVQVTPGSYAGEISWSLIDANGLTVASQLPGYYLSTAQVDTWVDLADGCYTMELYDSWGDGWNGGVYTIIDSSLTSYGSGGLISGSFGSDIININSTCISGCMDSTANNYDPLAAFDDGSCTFGCAGNALTLNMTDSYGDGWNGNVWNMYDLAGTVVASGTLLSGSTGTESLCIPDGCYTLSCDGGAWQTEVSWTLTDTSGAVVASGGAPGVQNLNLNSTCASGCTDLFASNYDPLAVFDDGTCLFPGCLDPLALNYCATCNVNDSTSCVYPVCNTLDFSDDFEAANLSGNGWTTLSGIESSVALTSANAIADTVSLEFTGNSFTGWINSTTESGAFANTDHVASATICLDMSGSAATVNMTLDAELVSYYSSAYGWFRIRIAGDVNGFADVNGNTSYNNQTLSGLSTLTYDLSAYANQSQVYVIIEAAVKYGPVYNALVADYVRVDNINVFNVYPCTYYTSSATATDASCNAGTDGTATATVSSPNATYDTYSWSDGQTTATATGLSAGTYTCTTTDTLNGCTSTATAVVGEPSAIVSSAVILNATSPLATDGAVDLTVGNGTPCYSGTNTVSGATPNNSYGGNVFNIIASADLGISSLDLFCQAGLGDVDVYYRNGSGEGLELDASAWTLAANQATMLNVAGLVNVPVSISATAGDTIGIYVICSNGMQYTSGNAPAYTTIISSDANLAISNGAGLGTYVAFSGSVFGPPNGARDFAGNVNYGTASYTYAWSNGATTQDVSGLGMGPIACTITDCNGCISTWNGFVMALSVPGCMDTLASNFDPSANTSDTSCTYPGCTDTLASNYDASSNLDDGSCTYSCDYYGYDDEITITYNSDFYADETSWQILNSNGDTVAASVPYASGTATYVTTACVNDGCFTIDMQDSWGDGWGFGLGNIMVQNSNGDTLISGATLATGSSGSEVFGVNSSCIVGCMDVLATNYDATATISDSTACIFCTDNMLTLNMYDSWGDGWNGNSFNLTDVVFGSSVATSTLAAGSAGTAMFCVPDGCYNIIVDYGAYQSEVSWDLTDASGAIIASGGAPYSGPLSLNTTCAIGCMDPLANNYDSTAVLADSCAYVGCMDMAAINYDANINVNDSTACIYPGCGSALPYTEDFSTGIANDMTLTWSATTGESLSSVDSTNNGTFSWHGQGGLYTGWNVPYSTGPDAFTYSPSHVASGSLCLDLTAYAGQGVMMTFDLRQTYSFNSTYSWFRVTDGTNVLSDNTGAQYFQPTTPDADAWNNVTLDLTALAGTQATIVFESACKYNDDYYQGGDNAFVDNINIIAAIAPVYGCTDSTASNYSPIANTDDGSCVSCGPGTSYVNINCDGGSFAAEVSWNLLDAAGLTVLSGGAPFNLDTCIADGCYTIDMVDSWGDGWNGNVFSITESMSGISSTATLASGSAGSASLSSTALGCYILGCTDILATNYDAIANTNDGTCTYPGCADVFPYSEDFETGTAADMTLISSTQSTSSVDSSNSQGVYSWQGQGGSSTGWLFPYATGPDAFNSVTHISTASLCLDLTSFAPGSTVAMSFDLRQEASFNVTYSWFRVKSDTNVLTSTAGNDYYTPSATCGDVWANHTYDLSAYAGSSITIDFQSSGKYSDDYYACGDNSFVDNISVVSAIYGCTDMSATNYNPAATADDGSCVYPCTNATGYAHGFEDGIASLNLTPADWTQNTDDNANNNANYGNWLWDNLGTGSTNTGPNYSTNYGGTGYAMEGSYYMFVESSGNYGNDVSMTSHCFDLSTLANANLSFWYNMYDGNTATMGSLDVMLSSDGGITWDSTWTATGNQGADWVQTSIDVSAYASTGVTVKITGTTGTTYTSDICIDAMTFVDGSQVYGCTDSTAWNYDATATADDGSCQYPCLDNEVTFEMFDSYGDGWNGSTYDVSLSGVSVATGGLASGYFATDTLCLVAGCYDVTVGGGSFLSEVSFNFGSLVGAAAGSYTDVSVGGAACGPILGCTDSTATNYDANATQDDGTCTYCVGTYANITVGGGLYMNEVSWTLTNSAGVSVATGGAPFSLDICLADDCYTVDMVDSWGDGWNGSTFDLDGVALGTILTGSTGSFTFSTGSASCAITGCTDSTASNYDATATVDDGSCLYPCLLDEVTLNLYDSWGDGWNGNIITVGGTDYTIVSGSAASFTLCVDLSICNTAAYTVVGSFSYPSENSWDIVDASGAIIASGGDNSADYGNCVVVISGCTDSTATNYNSLATVDDGSCTYPCLLDEVTLNLYDSYGDGWNGNSITVGGVDYTIAGFASSQSFTALCVDLSICNTAIYNPTGSYSSENSWDIVDASGAIIASGGDNSADFGNCFIAVLGCTDSTATNFDPLANTDDGSCIAVVLGCTDSTAFNYNPVANTDDNSCVAILYGCTDTTAVNYYSAANSDDGTCLYPGCTDSTATNYDASANLDDGTCLYASVSGCTDPLATNYNSLATVDDGSCILPTVCAKPIPTGLYIDNIIHSQAQVHWDNMSDAVCLALKYFIQVREVGTTSWTNKLASDAGLCNFGLPTTSKMFTQLASNTTYEYRMKASYCNTTGTSAWTALYTFTTADDCPNVTNFTATPGPQTNKVVFSWDTTASYSFVRVKLRVDSISAPTGSDWFSAGGFGVNFPALSVNKWGVVPGETYRGQARTWCNPNAGLYRSAGWTPLVFWTQPSAIRVEGGTSINNLDVYPNPSRDIFNVRFTSEDVQNLDVRIINVIGEIIYTENLNEFVGEYTKQVDLATYTKGIYFLEITTDNGVINKKLILQ